MALQLSKDALQEFKRLQAHNPCIKKSHPAWRLMLYTAVLNTYMHTNCDALKEYYHGLVQTEQTANPRTIINNPPRQY